MVRGLMIRAATLAMAAAALAACGSSGAGGTSGGGASDPPSTSSTPSVPTTASPASSGSAAATAGATIDPCTLLDRAAIDRLIGEFTEFNHVVTAQLPGCEWTNASSTLSVSSVPADEWAAVMPTNIAMLRVAAKGNQDKLDDLDRRAALFTGSMTAEQACAAFSTTLQWQGLPAEEWKAVTYAPDPQNPTLVAATACHEGRYSVVSLTKPDVVSSAAQSAAILDALVAADAAARGS